MNTSYLTDNQTQIWKNIAYELAANLTIQLQALNFYLQYRQHFKNNNFIDSQQRKITIFKIAYLLAQKSVCTYTIQGKKINTFAFSFNALLKDKTTNTEDFMYNLKEMIKAIDIQDKQLEGEINIFVRKFSFNMTFYNKFWATFGKIKFIPKLSQSQEAILKSFIWIIFITSKNFCLGESLNIVDCTCLMAVIFLNMVTSKALQFKQIILEDNYFSGSIHQKNNPKAQTLLLDFFRIKDFSSFNSVLKSFNNFTAMLIEKRIVDDQNLFNSKKAQSNYQKLDKHYQKNLKQDVIDQRTFLKQRINNNLHQNKFTPYGGKRQQKIKSDYFFQKVLNYQLDQQEFPNSKKQNNQKLNSQKQNKQRLKNQASNSAMLKNLKLISGTPTMVLIKSTPTTQAMQLYNFLFDKVKFFNAQEQYQNPVCEILKQFLTNDETNIKLTQHVLNQRIKLILGYYFYVINDLKNNQTLSQEDQLEYLVISIQICYFVLKITNSKNDCLDRALEQFQLGYDSIWAKISELVSQDKSLPLQIRIHLHHIESIIISIKLWDHSKKISHTPYLQIFSARTTPLMQNLYLRTVHHIAFQIHLLSTHLKISQQTENNTFLTIQFVLKNYPEMLINRSIDQLLLCSFYSNCRIKDASIKFNNIIDAYTQLNQLTKQFYNKLIQNVLLADQDDFGDIIKFYNVVFLMKMKGFLSDLKNQKVKKKKYDEDFIKTPISKMLPNSYYKQNIDSQAYFAYNQSPLLKKKRKQNIKQIIGSSTNLIHMKSLQTKKCQSQEQSSVRLEETLSLINKKFGRQISENQMRFVNYRNISK